MERFKTILVIFGLILISNPLFAQIYEGRSLKKVNFIDILDQVEPGTVLILGENHGVAAHRDQHIQIMSGIKDKGLPVSVGMEFLNYTDQQNIDLYLDHQMSDDQFLSAINWKGFDFQFYKQQILFPASDHQSTTLGLNIPRVITSKISKSGLESLTADEKVILPPGLTLGRDSYKERFRQAAGAHCQNFERCFAAQSVWDETMAWNTVKYVQAHPNQVFVIVVGEFHAQYGGGLADRIRARFPEVKIKIVSQLWAEGWSDDDLQNELKVSDTEGPRADFIWVSR